MNHETESLIRSLVITMHGWCSLNKAFALANLIERERPRLVVELGVFGGRSFIPQVLALRDLNAGGFAHGIDPWSKTAALEGMEPTKKDDRENIKWWSDVDIEAVARSVGITMEDLNLWPWGALIRARGELVVDLFHDVDVLHIDGNHTELASTRDVRLWLPRVRPGGWIWFDDANWPSVQPALRLLEESCRVERTFDESPAAFYRLYRKNPLTRSTQAAGLDRGVAIDEEEAWL